VKIDRQVCPSKRSLAKIRYYLELIFVLLKITLIIEGFVNRYRESFSSLADINACVSC
jgi:hypothetical protein